MHPALLPRVRPSPGRLPAPRLDGTTPVTIGAQPECLCLQRCLTQRPRLLCISQIPARNLAVHDRCLAAWPLAWPDAPRLLCCTLTGFHTGLALTPAVAAMPLHCGLYGTSLSMYMCRAAMYCSPP